MAVSKPFAVASAVLAGWALSACSSTGGSTSAKIESAPITVAYPRLPDSIVTVPAAYAAEAPAGGPFAEASATYAVASMAPEADSADAAIIATDAAGATSPSDIEPPVAQEATLAEQPMVLASADAGEAATLATASYAGPTPTAEGLALQAPVMPERGNAVLIHAPVGRLGPSDVDARSPELDALMARYAEHYEIPEELVRRVAKRESTFNPRARNGPYLGLMQISHATARGMGYSGSASGLFDADTNLKYAVRYLRGAWLVAKGNQSVADKLYQRGYYYDAKRAGLLDETGLGKDRRRRNPS